jgi:hypothetical protein
VAPPDRVRFLAEGEQGGGDMDVSGRERRSERGVEGRSVLNVSR